MVTDFYGKELEVGDSAVCMKNVTNGHLIAGKVVNIIPVKSYVGYYHLIDIKVESMKCDKLIRVRANDVAKYNSERTKLV